MTNNNYRDKNLALIQKIPTPITPVKIDQTTRHITLAYFDKQSTVDYIGTVQGVPVCFDAKECAVDTFPMMNIHEHQIKFMEDFEKQGGIAFIILFYSQKNEIYYLPFCDIKKFYDRSINGGRKSFRYDEVDKNYRLGKAPGALVHYLEGIAKDLESREQNN
jgi:recombination protein U